ncbi:MAG TPA: glycosyltransferase family 39 protein [Anaeromyxobacteraceae bacterium]|nr:glycosyltransferase family 39 protein [Anaeromyxobacteraceae bacterium]
MAEEAGRPGTPGAPRRGGALLAALVALAVFLPWLGSTGLWDPWEPHYAEVAREMVERADLVHPYWKEGYFFSKPALLLWTSALGLAAVGVDDRDLPPGADPSPPAPSGVSVRSEWAVRLPGALLAAGAVVFVYLCVARLASGRAALLAAVALATMPFYELLARQAIPDMPFVALATSGAMAFAVALLDDRPPGAGWAYAGYVLLAYATLAKGLLGFALVGAAFLAYLLVTGDYGRLPRLRLAEKVGPLWLPLGPLAFAAIAFPWYAAMTAFRGRDDEGYTFAYRFFVHDHAKRLALGVHTTTPGGTFTYFLEQLGYGTFPWVAALPGALGELLRARPRSADKRERLALLCGLWALVTYAVMSLSATKFHHYIFPAVPPLAVLVGLFLDRLCEEGLEEHLPALLAGLVLAAVVGYSLWLKPQGLADLFVYNYERPYPERELAELHPALRVGPFALSWAPRAVLSAFTAALSTGLALAVLWRSRRLFVLGLGGGALFLALWLSWFHWRELSPHWSEREAVAAYLRERGDPDEPLVAYFMNWRGETFYGRNRVREVMDDERMRDVARRPGKVWVILEKTRLPALKAVAGSSRQLRVVERSSNKYALVLLEERAPGAAEPVEPLPPEPKAFGPSN